MYIGGKKGLDYEEKIYIIYFFFIAHTLEKYCFC